MGSALEIARRLADRVRVADREMAGSRPEDPGFDERWDAAAAPLLELAHPEIEFRSHLIQAGTGRSYFGHDGFRDWGRDLYTVMSRFERVLAESSEPVEDVVVLRFDVTAVGRGSGAEVHEAVWVVWWFEQGLLRKSETYLEPGPAFEAASVRR